MARDFGHGGIFNQRALHHAVFKAIAHLHGLDLSGEFGDKAVIEPGLHIKAVGAHAGLAGIAVFAGHGAFHRRVQVGVVKHDKGRIAPQLQRHFFHCRGALRHQDAAHFGGAGKAQVAHGIAGANDFAYGYRIVSVCGQHIEHAGWNASAQRQFGGGQCRQRREFRRFDDDRTTRGQRRGHFARDHGQRKVPWRNGCAHAYGLLDDR